MQRKQEQIDGARWLAGRTRALLADEPGVGKSVQVVDACKQLNAKSVRVICPAVAIEHWHREFGKWGYSPIELEVVSYNSLLSRESFSQVDVLVVDEAHLAKNPDAARTMKVWAKGGAAWSARHVWALTGTPSPNRVHELWPMLRAFGATRLSYDQFTQAYCIIGFDRKVKGLKAACAPEIRAMLKPFTLRRLKADVHPELGMMDIQEWKVTPDPKYVPVMIDGGNWDGSYAVAKAAKLEAKMRSAIAGLNQEQLLDWLGSRTRVMGDTAFTTLRRYNALLKVPAIEKAIQFEIENGLADKIVVYGYHQEAMKLLFYRFKDMPHIGAELVYGETPAKKRDVAIQRFKRPNGPKVFIASILAAGTAIDLTCAHKGIMMELDWVPGNNWQAMQRMHRPGQKEKVSIRVAVGSEVDQIISNVVTSKMKDLAAVFD